MLKVPEYLLLLAFAVLEVAESTNATSRHGNGRNRKTATIRADNLSETLEEGTFYLSPLPELVVDSLRCRYSLLMDSRILSFR